MRMFCLSLVAVGLLIALFLPLEVAAHTNPQQVSWPGASYRIVRREIREGVVFDFYRGTSSRPEIVIGGSTDLGCDPPSLYVFDVDGDGIADVYMQACSGHEYLRYRSELDRLDEIDLGQLDSFSAPGLQTFWFAELMSGGERAVAIGGALFLFGAIGSLVSVRARRLPRPATRPASMV
jgi:hypothetical protein